MEQRGFYCIFYDHLLRVIVACDAFAFIVSFGSQMYAQFSLLPFFINSIFMHFIVIINQLAYANSIPLTFEDADCRCE